MRSLFEHVPRAVGGLDVLGSSAGGQLIEQVTEGELRPGKHTVQRTDQVVELLRRTQGMARAQHDTRTFSKAWLLMSRSAQHALDYDMRLYPPGAMEPHLARLTQALRECMGTLLGGDLPPVAWFQCSLPGRFGGLALRAANPRPMAAAAYASAHDAHWSVLPALLAKLGRPAAAKHDCEGDYVRTAREWLRDAGVAVAPGAKVALMEEAKLAYESSPWKHDFPAAMLVRPRPRDQPADDDGLEPVRSMARAREQSKLLSRFLAAAEGVAAAKLAKTLGADEANLLASAGGEGVGGNWTALHRHVLDLMRTRCGGLPRGCAWA